MPDGRLAFLGGILGLGSTKRWLLNWGTVSGFRVVLVLVLVLVIDLPWASNARVEDDDEDEHEDD
jgi:hypothetical protein